MVVPLTLIYNTYKLAKNAKHHGLVGNYSELKLSLFVLENIPYRSYFRLVISSDSGLSLACKSGKTSLVQSSNFPVVDSSQLDLNNPLYFSSIALIVFKM